MGTIFSYAIASALLLCLGYLAYKWIMSGERQHSCNRATLYIIYAMALTLPALAGRWNNLFPATEDSNMATIEISELSGGMMLQETSETALYPDVPTILTYIYFAGAMLTLVYSLFGAFQLYSIIRSGEKSKKGRYTLVISDRDDIAPFSWLNYYVMSRNDYETAGEIISIHERRHLRLLHWVDLIVVQIIDIFQWFNPAAWLMGEEFKTIHEYQADEAVMASGTNLRQYQTLLIKKAVGTRFQVLANSLNHSKLKKRVTMMYKSKSSRSRRFGALLLVPAMGIGCAVIEIPTVAAVLDTTSAVSLLEDNDGKVNDFSTNKATESVEIINNSFPKSPDMEFDSPIIEYKENEVEPPSDASKKIVEDKGSVSSQTDNTDVSPNTNATFAPSESAAPVPTKEAKDEKDEVYVAVEQQAEFPGGMSALMKWLSENVKYPEKAYKENIQGRVIVKFVIQKDGKIGDATVIRGIDPELDKEALRLIEIMPSWKPAENKGEPVASYFNIPITFKLKGDSAKTEATETPIGK